MHILHLLYDGMVAPFTQSACEAAWPGSNRFRIHCPAGDPPRFASLTHGAICADGYYASESEMREDFSWCDVLLVHGMTAHSARIARQAPPDVAVVWCGWGADYYNLIYPSWGQMVLPETLKIAPRPWRTRWIPLNVHQRLEGLRRRLLGRYLLPRWAALVAPRIDYFCSLSGQNAGLASALPGFRALPMPSFRYYSVEDVFAKGPPAMEGPDILVGNSATATNNHVEAFNLLAGCDLNGRRIIVPLSYFDEAYADAVVRLGRELFGDRFVPLREFMPIERYNKTVASCGTVIMNHVRGQAMGNLTTALYKGAKLFLRPENPYLRFYADHGAHLFSLSQDAVDPKTIFTPLSDEQKAQNKRIVESIWGFDAVVEHIRWMIRDVTKENGGIDELDRGNSSTLV